MSNTSSGYSLAALFSGRWQIPVALAAAVTACVTLYHLVPGPVTADVKTLLADVAALEASGATTDAADALVNLLEMQPPPPPAVQAELHERLAELVYRQELKRGSPNLQNARLALEHHDAASRQACPENALRLLREAQLAEWLENEARILPAYRRVLELAPAPAERRRALQGIVSHLANRPGTHAERQRLLYELLADEGVTTGYFWWALQESLQEALDENDTVRARQVLEQHGARLKSSDLRGYWEYLWAWVMLCEGRVEEAAPLAAWVDEWLSTQPPAAHELKAFGSLPTLNRWLLGQIHLAEHRPQAALEEFEHGAELQPFGELSVALSAGKASALTELQRDAAAEQALRHAAQQLEALAGVPEARRERLRRRLFQPLQTLMQRSADPAAAYVIAAAEELTRERLDLLAKLEEGRRLAADESSAAEARRAAHGEAGRQLEQAAQLCAADETRGGALLWLAAGEYQQAEQMADARRVLRRFLDGRTADARRPRALLLLAEAFEADGLTQDALRWYGRLTAEFPRLDDAYRARLLAAACLRALGQDAEAETALRELLADDNITPQAEVFRDALLELCDLLREQGRYGEAIGRLEEFSERYPGDAERYRARFMLADACRRSAAALREGLSPDAGTGREEATSRERLRQAAGLFDELLRDLSAEHAPDPELALYEQLAVLYRADCLFDLNDPQALEEALATYRLVAARYEREPAALTAQVQMANIYLRLGLPVDAARAIERARWLLPNIPDDSFSASADGADRQHWERYLAALATSDLFRGAFVGGP